MSDPVNSPAHYGGRENFYEAIKVIEAWRFDFLLGNAAKYISRAGKKSEDPNEDIKKALWYLRRADNKIPPKGFPRQENQQRIHRDYHPPQVTKAWNLNHELAQAFELMCLQYYGKAVVLIEQHLADNGSPVLPAVPKAAPPGAPPAALAVVPARVHASSVYVASEHEQSLVADLNRRLDDIARRSDAESSRANQAEAMLRAETERADLAEARAARAEEALRVHLEQAAAEKAARIERAKAKNAPPKTVRAAVQEPHVAQEDVTPPPIDPEPHVAQEDVTPPPIDPEPHVALEDAPSNSTPQEPRVAQEDATLDGAAQEPHVALEDVTRPEPETAQEPHDAPEVVTPPAEVPGPDVRGRASHHANKRKARR